MATLESRVEKLESQSPGEADELKVIFLHDGESKDSARRRYGIPSEFAGTILAVSFIDSPKGMP